MIYLIPILNAAFGWMIISFLFYLLFHPQKKKNIFVVQIQGLIPGKLPEWGYQLGKYASENFINISRLKQNILEEENLKKINLLLEDKVDDFLRNKLKDRIPVLGMFITEGLISKMKETLMSELEHMIPDMIGFFADDLEKKYNVQQLIADKLAQVDPATLEKTFYEHAGKSVMQLKIFVAALGLLLGGFEIILIKIFSTV